MKNLLHDAISEQELTALLAERPSVALLPREMDAAWQSAAEKPVLQDALQALRQRATAELDSPLPVLSDALYADFTVTGNRLNFEKLYFERRRQVTRAAISTLVETDPVRREAFRQSLHRGAATIFQEESWALPAHVKAASGKDPMMIDLFAAETANLFAELLTVFAASWPEGFEAQVRQRLRTQFFDNYLAHDWHWGNSTNNWNAVCHQGVLGAALAVEPDAELLAKMLMKARQYLPNFLKGYTSDGATAEGPGYWSYGFGWFAELNAQLEMRSGGALSLFEGDPLIDRIARFGPALALERGNLVNFSDSPSSGGLRPSLLQYLGERLNDPKVIAGARYFWGVLAKGPTRVDGERSDFFCWSRVLSRAPDGAVLAETLPTGESYFDGVDWMVVRSRDAKGHICEFAAKSGHNEEHHNHNDVGSYLLHIDGERMILEIGAPEYVRDFFRGETRYQFLATRSLGHSVPLINGTEQPAGAEFAGKVIEHMTNEKEAVFALDFTHAYPSKAGLLRGIRRIYLDKQAGILRVRDDFDLSRAEAVETALITAPNAQMEGENVIVKSGAVKVRIVPEEGTIVKELQRHEYRAHSGRPAQVMRVVLCPKQLDSELELGYAVEVVD